MSLFSQAVFYKSGTIKYERKINAYRLMEGSWFEKMYEKQKFVTDTFSMVFDSIHSLYGKNIVEEDANTGMSFFSFSVAPDKSNIVYKDLRAKQVIAIRDLFEETISIEDTLRNIEWKIMGETREIAGFRCHKAVGTILDSVYIVAFYTDQIIPSMGPETMGGLPGTILGLAVPRLYTSWMAISFTPEIEKEITLPKTNIKKNSKFGWNSYYVEVSDRFKDWGSKYATIFVWMWGI